MDNQESFLACLMIHMGMGVFRSASVVSSKVLERREALSGQ